MSNKLKTSNKSVKKEANAKNINYIPKSNSASKKTKREMQEVNTVTIGGDESMGYDMDYLRTNGGLPGQNFNSSFLPSYTPYPNGNFPLGQEDIYPRFDSLNQYGNYSNYLNSGYNPGYMNTVSNGMSLPPYYPPVSNDYTLGLNSNTPLFNIYDGMQGTNFNMAITPHNELSRNQQVFPTNARTNPNQKIPLKSINDEDYIYVNPKQYLRILQRREKRKKLNSIMSRLGGKNIFEESNGKRKYKHESRHKHAMTRERGKGGRFTSKKEEKNK